jgi:hypothetical protein
VKNLIVISKKYGQLCNNIILYSNFLVFSKKYKIKLYNPSFYKYAQYFSGSFNNNRSTLVYLIFHLISKIKFNSKLLKIIKDSDEEIYFLDENVEDIKKAKICFFSGWFVRTRDSNYERTHSLLTDFFRPVEKHMSKINDYLNSVKQGNDIIVGIHIRRGDYIKWRGGKFYYSDISYMEKMKEFANLQLDKKVKFVLCSNKSIQLSSFKNEGLDCVLGPGNEIEDLYVLAGCDYILGPPSTYSIWASYFGKKPLYHIEDLAKKINLEDFNVVKNLCEN